MIEITTASEDENDGGRRYFMVLHILSIDPLNVREMRFVKISASPAKR